MEKLPSSLIPTQELHPLVFARIYIEVEGDFDALARKKHRGLDLMTVREIALRRLTIMEKRWWEPDKTLYPSLVHFWVICLGHTEAPEYLSRWIESYLPLAPFL